MSQNSLKSTIQEIFQEVFPELSDQDLDWEKQQNDYENWDSFAHLRIVGELEKKFDITLELDDVIYVTSALGFLNLMEKKSPN